MISPTDHRGAWRHFWRQPCRPYRDFWIGYVLLAANFVLPAIVYTVAPQQAFDQFLALQRLLGGGPYTFPEAGSRAWRYLAAANVMTLGLMCLLLLWNLRAYWRVLVPLTFMKGYAAACWLGGWVADPSARVFAAAFVLDAVTCVLFVVLATRAHRAIAGVDDAVLVPRPRRPWP